MLSYEHLEEIESALYDKDVFWINDTTGFRIVGEKNWKDLDPVLILEHGYLDANNVSPRDIFIGRRLED